MTTEGFNTDGNVEEGDIPDPRPEDIEALKADHEAGIVNAKKVAGEVSSPRDEIREVAGLPIEAVPNNLMASEGSTSGQIEILYRNGYSQQDIEAAGFNHNSVRTIISTLRGKYGNQLLKEQKELGMVKTDKPSRAMVRGKGNELAQFMSQIEVPEGDLDTLKNGIQFGMSLMVMAVRMVQEMSAIGVQQSKPLIEIAKTMREGEKDAAKNSAIEAGMAAAQAVEATVGPQIAEIRNKVENINTAPQGANPMQQMFMNAMQGPFQQLMSSMFAGLTGVSGTPALPGNQPVGTPAQPAGNWEVTEE